MRLMEADVSVANGATAGLPQSWGPHSQVLAVVLQITCTCVFVCVCVHVLCVVHVFVYDCMFACVCACM